MNQTSAHSGSKAVFFAVIAIVSFFACFILAPLGSFVAWIFGGLAAYFVFLSIYSLIPRTRKRFTRRRDDPRQEEMRTYIALHMRILGTVFLAAILIVVAILVFAL